MSRRHAVVSGGSNEYTIITGIYATRNTETAAVTFMNTGYVPTVKTRMVIEIADLRNQAGCNYMGVRNPNFAILSYGSTSQIGCMGVSANIRAISWDNNKHVYDMYNGYFSVDGVVLGHPSLSGFSTTCPITIFQTNDAQIPTASNPSFAKAVVYSAQIYEDGVLVRDYKKRRGNLISRRFFYKGMVG